MRCLLLILLMPLTLAAWPPGFVKRYFYETPKGFLHYVVRGDVKARPPLVFFHGHPRSSEEFVPLAIQIPETQPFIAIDYFGAGHSDECICNETHEEFVTYESFALMALEICDGLGVQKVVPFGSLTGASPAIEFSALAAEQGRIEYFILFEVYYLSPGAMAHVDSVYIPSIRHLPLYVNGSHLTWAWYRSDAGPIGPSSPEPAVQDLVKNQQKTVDWFLSWRTGWQYKMAWTKYNDKILPRFTQLVAAKVKTLFITGTFADAMGNKYGLDHDWSEARINETVPENMRRTERVVDGTEGSLEQNATLVSGWIHDFLGGWTEVPINI